MQTTIRRLKPIAIAELLVLIFMSCFAAAIYAQPAAEPKTVVVYGDSRIYSDLSNAKNAAISDGLTFAVQAASADLLSTAELTADFESVSSLLIDRRDEFIQNYKIIRELRTDKHYRVLVQATILMDRLQQELSAAGIGATADRLPAVLMMIAEKPLDYLDFQYWWQNGQAPHLTVGSDTSISSILREKGLRLVDWENTGQGRTNPGFGYAPSNYDAARFAGELGADLVVVGTSRVAPSSNRMGSDLRAMKAEIDARIVRTDTGETLATVREHAVAAGEDPEITAENALADARRQAGEQLAARIIPLWSQSDANTGKIMISVSGANILPHLERFRQALQRISGVSGLQTRQVTPNLATLELQYKGTYQELADSMLIQSYDQFGINISRSAPGRLEVELHQEF